MGTLAGLLSRMQAEEGYVEKASEQDLDSKTANAGRGNFTKYSRDVDRWGLMGCQGQPWCCTFQFAQEGYEFGVEEALRHWNMTRETYVGYNCFATLQAFRGAGQTGMEPRLGAVAIFSFSHAGRVVRTFSRNGKRWWDCLEANTSAGLSERDGGQVKKKTRPWQDPAVKGFCYIDYREEPIRKEEGWVRAADGVRWWYQYPDGSFALSGWRWLREKTGGTWGWYLFDDAGYMLTGYQTAPDGRKYFLCPDPGIHEGKCMITDGQGELRIAAYDWKTKQYG